MNRSEISILAERAKDGDREAFEALYNEFRDRVYFFAKRTAGEHHAEDITSETFITAFEKISSLRDNSSFVAWIYGIAYRISADRVKDEARTEHYESEREMDDALADSVLSEPVMLPEDYAVREDVKRRLAEVIDRLPPDRRSAVMLYYFEEQSVPEIAKAQGTTEKTVSQRLYKARKTIRRHLEKLTEKGALLMAVPLEGLMYTLTEQGLVSTSARAAGSKFALKFAAVGAAAAVAVGIPIMAHRLYGGGGYRPDDSSTPTRTTTTTATAVTTTTTTAPEQKPAAETKTITAEVTDYKDGRLFFTYEGKEYRTEMSQSKFYEDGSFVRPERYWPTLSEKIIRNRSGEKIMGYITVNEDMTDISMCDVMTPNVRYFSGDYPYYYDEQNRLRADPDRLYSFKRTEGSKCIVANKYNSYEFDLNDLIIQDRPRFEDEYDIVTFSGYKFASGNIILKNLLPARKEKDGTVTGKSEYLKELVMRSIGYCGTVLKNENGTAEVLLNDGKTVLVVPSYFNDGEVIAGMQVMVDTQQTEEKFCGTGQRAELDLAVIYTVKEHYISSSHDHEPEDLAYIILGTEESRSMSDYTYVTAEEFKNSHREG